MDNLINFFEEAICKHGGQKSDISFLDTDQISEIGKQLAAKGIKSRTPNPAFNVIPINTVAGISQHFDGMYDWITPITCPVKPVADEPRIIELIKVTPFQDTEATLKEIDALGFAPAPSNYVLGLGVQYPDVHKEYRYIVSLDEQNVFPGRSGSPCFLCLSWGGERELSLAYEAGGWSDGWWFAVVRKDSSTPQG